MDIHPVRTPGLGDTSYLLVHDAHGIVVDPQRDIGRFLDLIEQTGTVVTHVLDTHLHNDYLTGAPGLARRLDADLVLPAGAGVAYPFVPAFHREALEGSDGLAIRPLHTPGHTPEHVSYVVTIDGEDRAVFTGGSLLVGSAGRTDLLGKELAVPLARLQHGSVFRLATLDDAVGVYPTHGEGSFCTASATSSLSSTIADERATNPVLAYPDVDAFVSGQLEGLLPYPSYYRHMAPLNRLGPEPWIPTPPPELDADGLRSQLAAGAQVVDARSTEEYAAGHLPGSLNIGAGSSFAAWVGWLVPFGTPVVLVIGTHQDPVELTTELARIGYEVSGFVCDSQGLAGSSATRLASLRDLEQVLGRQIVIDVRDPAEWSSGHLRHTTHRYLPDLRDGLPEDTDGEVWLVCASGYRSAAAAGLVERYGATPVVVQGGGVSSLLDRRPDLASDQP